MELRLDSQRLYQQSHGVGSICSFFCIPSRPSLIHRSELITSPGPGCSGSRLWTDDDGSPQLPEPFPSAKLF